LAIALLAVRSALPEPSAAVGLARARQALEAARRAMWGKALHLAAEVRIHSREGRRRLLADIDLLPGPPPRTVFHLRSILGAPLEQMEIEWRPDGAVWRRVADDGRRQLVPAGGAAAVADTFVRWQDLTLPFLWWTNLHYLGKEQVKGRECDVVDLAAPPGELRWSRVRIYVDRELAVILRAETFDRRGAPDAVVEAKAIRRVPPGFWIVSRLDITRPGENIIVRVRDVSTRESGQRTGPTPGAGGSMLRTPGAS